MSFIDPVSTPRAVGKQPRGPPEEPVVGRDARPALVSVQRPRAQPVPGSEERAVLLAQHGELAGRAPSCVAIDETVHEGQARSHFQGVGDDACIRRTPFVDPRSDRGLPRPPRYSTSAPSARLLGRWRWSSGPLKRANPLVLISRSCSLIFFAIFGPILSTEAEPLHAGLPHRLEGGEPGGVERARPDPPYPVQPRDSAPAPP